MKALINANIYDFNTYRPNSYILYDTIIKEVGEMGDFKGAEEIFDCKNALVLPGLIIGHAHIYSAFVRGILLPFKPDTFKQLLEQLWWRLDRGIDLATTYYSARVSGIEHIKCGVTTIIDHHASGTSIRGTLSELKRGICDDTGMRGIFCFETSDRFNVDECISENLDFYNNAHSNRCAGMFGMHASLSLSEASLEKVKKAIGDIPIHIHVGESLQDEENCLMRFGKRVVHRLDDHGLLNQNSILAHCVHIDEEEAGIIAEHGCAVAVNPTSNMNNGVGLPDVSLFKKHNIRTFIGNDSLGTDITREYLNLLYGMHLKTRSPWQFSYNDLLDCIKSVYAYAELMLGIKIGRIEPGYAADMITLPYQAPTVMNEENIFSHLINGVFTNFHPREVWCSGEIKLKNYQTIWDEEEVFAKAREVSKRLWKRIGAK